MQVYYYKEDWEAPLVESQAFLSLHLAQNEKKQKLIHLTLSDALTRDILKEIPIATFSNGEMIKHQTCFCLYSYPSLIIADTALGRIEKFRFRALTDENTFSAFIKTLSHFWTCKDQHSPPVDNSLYNISTQTIIDIFNSINPSQNLIDSIKQYL